MACDAQRHAWNAGSHTISLTQHESKSPMHKTTNAKEYINHSYTSTPPQPNIPFCQDFKCDLNTQSVRQAQQQPSLHITIRYVPRLQTGGSLSPGPQPPDVSYIIPEAFRRNIPRKEKRKSWSRSTYHRGRSGKSTTSCDPP